jgi:predicted NBD/HSP70 family sugar kinase
MSLAELVAATGASLPTVRRAVQRLTRERWIRIVGREGDTGGRPANLFGFDDAVRTVVGVHLAHPGMRLVATDLAGTPLAVSVPEDLDQLEPDRVVAEVEAFLRAFRRERPKREVLGLGVATPGYVDAASGTVMAIGRAPAWRNLPLRERLRRATDLPVVVGNDMDALATAEFGVAEPIHSALYVGFGEGLKYSMILDGAPFTGPFGNAGLIASDLLAGPCRTGDEALTGLSGVVAAYHRDRPGEPPVRGAEAVRRRFHQLLDEAVAGEASACSLVARWTEVIGAQTAAVVHLLQPEALVFGGELAAAPRAIQEGLEAACRAHLPTLLDNALEVRPAGLRGPEATAVGAARAFLQRYLTTDEASVAAPERARAS